MVPERRGAQVLFFAEVLLELGEGLLPSFGDAYAPDGRKGDTMKRFVLLMLLIMATLALGCARGVPPLDPLTGRSAEPVQIPEELVKLQYGFNGSRIYHRDKPTGKGVIVLETSLTIADEGKWRAWGLVRNELPHEVGDVKVTAALFAADGRLLEQPSVPIQVDPLRPGEPAPFMVGADTPAASVARVEWSVTEGKPNPQATRDLETQFYWQFPYGKAEPRPGTKRTDPPYPYVLAAGFVNRNGPLLEAYVVAAWLDRDGRIFWIETARMAPEFKRPLPPDGAANFDKIQVYDPSIGPRLDQADNMLWTVGLRAGR